MKLEELAGTYWSKFYQGELFKDLIKARAELEKQTQEELDTLQNCLNRETTPVFHKRLLTPLVLDKDTMLSEYVWKLDDNIIAIDTITDAIHKPTRTLDNQDYTIKDGHIIFKENPLINDSTTLFARNLYTDEKYLANLYGTQLNLSHSSSEDYKTLLCTIYEILIKGLTKTNFQKLFDTLYTASHSLPPPRIPIFHDHNIPNTALPELTIQKHLLDKDINEDLKFPNRLTDTTKSKDGKYRFPINGTKEALKAFWAKMDKYSSDKLNKLLKDKINPCEFVLKHIYLNNATIVVLREHKIKDSLKDIDIEYVLKLIVPPTKVLLLQG